MSEPHPLVLQLRFTRAEFLRGVRGVPAEDAKRRLGPMNSLSWNVGHLAWQEQRYFLTRGQGITPYPDIQEQFAYGARARRRAGRHLAAWRAITAAADPWLDAVTTAKQEEPVSRGKPIGTTFGNLLQRVIYHYWYHTGENQAIRQQLGHTRCRSSWATSTTMPRTARNQPSSGVTLADDGDTSTGMRPDVTGQGGRLRVSEPSTPASVINAGGLGWPRRSMRDRIALDRGGRRLRRR